MECASGSNKYHYNPLLRDRASLLRKTLSKGQAVLWKYALKSSKMGYSFNRQRPVLNYVVDFMCRELLLIIEVEDVSTQTDSTALTQKSRLEEVGFTILTFSEQEVLTNLDRVRLGICDVIYQLESNRRDVAGSSSDRDPQIQ